MGGAACPRIAQETLRRTSRMCVVACRRVQAAQRLRSCALGAGGRFAAYKAEVAGSRPAAPTRCQNYNVCPDQWSATVWRAWCTRRTDREQTDYCQFDVWCDEDGSAVLRWGRRAPRVDLNGEANRRRERRALTVRDVG